MKQSTSFWSSCPALTTTLTRVGRCARHGIAVEVHLEDSQIVEASRLQHVGSTERGLLGTTPRRAPHTGKVGPLYQWSKKFHQIHEVSRSRPQSNHHRLEQPSRRPGRSLEAGLLLRGPCVGVFRDAHLCAARDVEDWVMFWTFLARPRGPLAMVEQRRGDEVRIAGSGVRFAGSIPLIRT